MNVTLRQLRGFVAIAQSGSFTRAAEQVHITQAGLSLMIREFEVQIGCSLFERTTRAVRLTQAGRMLLPFAERTLRDAAEVLDRLNKLSDHAARTLTVAATPLVAADVLPAVCQDLTTTRADIRVIVKDVDRRQIQAMVESGEVDAGLGILFKSSSTLAKELLMQLPLVCVSAAGALAGVAKRNSVTWAQLRNLPMVRLPTDNAIQQLVDKNLGSRAPAADPPTFSNLYTLIAMAEAGRGVAVLPSFVTQGCRRYRVDVCPIVSPSVSTGFFCITKQGAQPSPALAPFLVSLKARMEAFSRRT
ncbi:LysR family transcriptional regulator [Ramlibacter rhizophilus]|uniref:LysR family transcriptional regulator n=1 Tax=Ramlibacter rhizophilus TaxID=1781167 RepID=A0A4Z0BY37_9BURK|nr:LysR family transcriptional regulator [Ramlibacter rhizophilus]TFZ03434.1 LysR family transcriptional regulator [Ramlibacter rhizophilus]